jgi:hypothetical protein
MTKEALIAIEYDGLTGLTIERELTELEIAERKKQQDAFKKQEAEAKAKAEARQSALAKLAALGLTEAEIASL